MGQRVQPGARLRVLPALHGYPVRMGIDGSSDLQLLSVHCQSRVTSSGHSQHEPAQPPVLCRGGTTMQT